MTMYTSGGNTTVRTQKDIINKKGALNKRTLKWLKGVQRSAAEAEALCDVETGECGRLDFKAATRVVEEIGEQYRGFNQHECEDLTATLTAIEDSQHPGRVLLSDFYKPGLHNSWNFTENEDYLRALGTLDETDLANPRVIVPNYVYSRPNCLATSEMYVVCCKNHCEDKMGKLEKEIASPTATAKQIENVLGKWAGAPSLNELAANHDGVIPLHSRAFAQWLHEVFPRECPRPHSDGLSHAHDAEDWRKESGHDGTIAGEAEMLKQERHICGPDGSGCTGIETIDSNMVLELPPDPTHRLEVREAPLFPWSRSIVIFAFMMYIVLVRCSSKNGKSAFNQFSEMARLYLSKIKTSHQESLAPDGDWV